VGIVTYENLADDLLTNVPELRKMYEEHLADYDQVLPHVLLGDMVRYMVLVSKETHDLSTRLKRIVDWIEKAVEIGDERVREAIVVSFLENLDKYESEGRQIESRLGPQAAEAF
jgi:hypothetical protein